MTATQLLRSGRPADSLPPPAASSWLIEARYLPEWTQHMEGDIRREILPLLQRLDGRLETLQVTVQQPGQADVTAPLHHRYSLTSRDSANQFLRWLKHSRSVVQLRVNGCPWESCHVHSRQLTFIE